MLNIHFMQSGWWEAGWKVVDYRTGLSYVLVDPPVRRPAVAPKIKTGFTLIELLIVVAIIAILAAIAVPNFLEAQTRAKAARAKSDLRTLVTGIESYRVDYNHCPFDWADDLAYPYYLNKGMTTPIAYVSNAARMEDVFATKRQLNTPTSPNPNLVKDRFRYRAFSERYLSGGTASSPFQGLPGPTSPGGAKAVDFHGSYFLVSKGPDGKINIPVGFTDGGGTFDWFWELYDPTNGTLSKGDIIRSQKRADVNSSGYTGTGVNVNY
ncbi:hypothetical protein BH09SUM1_BH09SUM1_33240 [soil metagenome]